MVSSGDGFSAERAREFEVGLEGCRVGKGGSASASTNGSGDGVRGVKWDIVTVRRARRVHQGLLTTPISSLECLVDCLGVLCGRRREGGEKSNINTNTNTNTATQSYAYPDLILTNGPGTGVIMVLASLILLFLGIAPIHDKKSEKEMGSMRTIYIESWARVKKLSLSGRILRFLASRVLVQWRGLGVVDLTRVDGENGTVGGERKNGSGSGSMSMRVQKRGIPGNGGREDGRMRASVSGSGNGTDTTIWPRRTEYIGAVVT